MSEKCQLEVEKKNSEILEQSLYALRLELIIQEYPDVMITICLFYYIPLHITSLYRFPQFGKNQISSPKKYEKRQRNLSNLYPRSISLTLTKYKQEVVADQYFFKILTEHTALSETHKLIDPKVTRHRRSPRKQQFLLLPTP